MKIKTNSDVYAPAEDSFLLAKYAKKLKGKILEVGCGSGIVALECAAADKKNIVEGVDINPEAIKISRENAKLNNIKNIRFYESDLFQNVKGKYDFILFNPPYLPTKEEEKIKSKLNYAFDGGKNGLETLSKFVRKVKKYLKKDGTVYLIASSLCGIDEVKKLLNKNGFKVDVIEEECFFFEKIALLKAKIR
ncbi:MAG: class I SAM-dependent methyltransferase [Candidatus Bilamarchaeaceae archaeon]